MASFGCPHAQADCFQYALLSRGGAGGAGESEAISITACFEAYVLYVLTQEDHAEGFRTCNYIVRRFYSSPYI